MNAGMKKVLIGMAAGAFGIAMVGCGGGGKLGLRVGLA